MRLSIEQCNKLIDLAESIPVEEWDVVNTMGRASYNTVSVSIPEDIKYILEKYCKDLLDLELYTLNVGIIRYRKGDKFARHTDYNTNIEFNKDFLYNINVRLNDDFEGGDFYLNDELFHKPVGEIYHYKSTMYHEVKEIINGVRYLALFYIRHRDIKNKKQTFI